MRIPSGQRADGRFYPRALALAGAAALVFAAAPVMAQDESASPEAMDMSGLTIAVSGVEYAFTGLPLSVPVGTNLTFTNNGTELHEMMLVRITDGVTESIDELLAMEDPVADGLVEMVGTGAPLMAVPGQTAEGSFTLDTEGRYVALCFVPTGLDAAKLEEFGIDLSMLGPDTDPADFSPEAQAFLEEVMGNPPHFTQGMVQEFQVTAADTEVGALPDA